MYKYIVIFLTVILYSATIIAQENPQPKMKSPMSSRIFIGGGLGLQFGTVTLVDVSPLIGYWFTEKLAGGLGFTYQYYQDKRYIPEYSTSIFGISVFGRYYVFRDVFAHAEYEWLNYEANSFIDDSGRINLNNILLGGGYRQWIGPNSFMAIELLWNVNESVYSLYQNPIIRIGFGFGI